MITRWTDWKTYPRASRAENIEAPVSAGVFEVREATSGKMFKYGAVDNLARSLAELSEPRSRMPWFGRRATLDLADLEYRTFATRNRAEAQIAIESMADRRVAYMKAG